MSDYDLCTQTADKPHAEGKNTLSMGVWLQVPVEVNEITEEVDLL